MPQARRGRPASTEQEPVDRALGSLEGLRRERLVAALAAFLFKQEEEAERLRRLRELDR
ncbi:MAG: hypothetical protein ABIO70_20885 [Pseudomonadota bacterium]